MSTQRNISSQDQLPSRDRIEKPGKVVDANDGKYFLANNIAGLTLRDFNPKSDKNTFNKPMNWKIITVDEKHGEATITASEGNLNSMIRIGFEDLPANLAIKSGNFVLLDDGGVDRVGLVGQPNENNDFGKVPVMLFRENPEEYPDLTKIKGSEFQSMEIGIDKFIDKSGNREGRKEMEEKRAMMEGARINKKMIRVLSHIEKLGIKAKELVKRLKDAEELKDNPKEFLKEMKAIQKDFPETLDSIESEANEADKTKYKKILSSI